MTARFIVADVFDGLATIPDGSVDLVITSPPFLALRSYLPADHPDKSKEIGSEATPAEFIDVLLKVTAELRRVLAPHGSICIELGDTYAGSGGAGGDYNDSGLRSGQERFDGSAKQERHPGRNEWEAAHPIPVRHGGGIAGGDGWPLAKSRTLIPQLYEIALAYGINPLTGQPSSAGQWRIRNVVTWARPNPPVGLLGDKWRPATSDLIVACTSSKRYWDDLATRKPAKYGEIDPARRAHAVGADGFGQPPRWTGTTATEDGDRINSNPSGAPLLDYWEIPPTEGLQDPKIGEQDRSDPHLLNHGGHMGTSEHGAPALDYWIIPPTGYSGSHYAVFPPALVEPCVKAMCPPKVCLECGEPSRRIVTFGGGNMERDELRDERGTNQRNPRTDPAERVTSATDLGWTDCGHDNYRPGLILDPFAGSGTTLLVATGHGHDAIGIDIDSRNLELTMDRVGPFLMEIV